MDKEVHIGELIKRQVESNGIRVSWLAQQLGCHRNNVYVIYNRSWIDTKTLMSICKILHHDFFADLSKQYQEEST